MGLGTIEHGFFFIFGLIFGIFDDFSNIWIAPIVKKMKKSLPKIHFVMWQIAHTRKFDFGYYPLRHYIYSITPINYFLFSPLLEYGVLAVTCINEDMRENFTFREFSIQHKETEDVR